MIQSLLISLPMIVCLFWAAFFCIRLLPRKSRMFSLQYETPRVTAILALFYLMATVLYTDHWLYFSGIESVWGEWSYGVVNLCVYPLYYAYLRVLTRAKKSIEVPILLIPAVAALILFPIGRFGLCIANEPMFLVIRICFTIQVIWVLIRGWQLLKSTIRRMDDTYSDDRSRLLYPTHVSLLIFGITAVVSMILNFMGRDFFAHGTSVVLPAIVMTTLLYGLGYIAAHTIVPPEAVAEETTSEQNHPEEDTNTLIHKIDMLMRKNELFRNSELTIYDLARATNSNRTYVSMAINQAYNVNFATYVNRFRIEESKRILADSSIKQDKEAISYAQTMSGFQTEQTFYRVFKELTGTTPLLYRRSTRSLTADF